MQNLVSPKQAARAMGVSESTLKRWCDRGLIPMTKTVGGHRRMAVEDVLRFVRERGKELVEPAILGLPASTGSGMRTLRKAKDQFLDALAKGEETTARQIVFDLFLAGHTVTSICEDLIAATFHEIGDRWECGDLAVYEERRACQTSLYILRELRDASQDVGPESPLAIGGTAEGDTYTLPVTMAGLVLRSLGWNASALGSGLPFETLCQAVRDTTPRLFWLSVSHIPDTQQFVDGATSLFETTLQTGTAFAIGGRALTREIRTAIQFNTYCETFRDLEMFARSLHPVSSRPTPPVAREAASSD